MAERTLAKNTTYFTAALTVQKILSFIYFWFISNNLFPGQLGQYVFALSFTTLFSVFIDLGLSPVLTREASKKEENANRLLSNILGIKIPLAIITFIATWLIINFTNKDPDVKLLVYLASFIMVLDSFTLSFWVIFRSRHNLRYESLATILVQLIIFGLGLWALLATGQVKNLILALLAASGFNFLFALSLLKIRLKFSLKPRWQGETVVYLLRLMPAFALAGVFVKIYNTSDSVLLSFLAGDEAVGFYAIPAKVVSSFQQIIPAAFAAVIFPAFSYYYANSKHQLTQTFVKACRYIVILSLPLAVGLSLLAGPIVQLVWPGYLPVVPTFILMASAIPFIFLAFPTGYLLNACDRQKNNTFNRGLIMALSLILNLWLIPLYSFYGAGLTYLITNTILLGLDFWWVKKIIPLPWLQLGGIIGKSALATTVMAALIMAFLNFGWPVWLIIPAVAGVYFLVLLAIRGFTFREFKLQG